MPPAVHVDDEMITHAFKIRPTSPKLREYSGIKRLRQQNLLTGVTHLPRNRYPLNFVIKLTLRAGDLVREAIEFRADVEAVRNKGFQRSATCGAICKVAKFPLRCTYQPENRIGDARVGRKIIRIDLDERRGFADFEPQSNLRRRASSPGRASSDTTLLLGLRACCAHACTFRNCAISAEHRSRWRSTDVCADRVVNSVFVESLQWHHTRAEQRIRRRAVRDARPGVPAHTLKLAHIHVNAMREDRIAVKQAIVFVDRGVDLLVQLRFDQRFSRSCSLRCVCIRRPSSARASPRRRRSGESTVTAKRSVRINRRPNSSAQRSHVALERSLRRFAGIPGNSWFISTRPTRQVVGQHAQRDARRFVCTVMYAAPTDDAFGERVLKELFDDLLRDLARRSTDPRRGRRSCSSPASRRPPPGAGGTSSMNCPRIGCCGM